VTSRVSRNYLDSLEGLSWPLDAKLVIKQTGWLDLVKRDMFCHKRMAWKNIERISLALTALVDDYIGLFPLFAKRKPLAPGEEQKSLSWRMLAESAPYENVTVHTGGGFDYEKGSLPLVKRRRKTFLRARSPQY
jgi:hypothetical protein